jgi:hypothetical protein
MKKEASSMKTANEFVLKRDKLVNPMRVIHDVLGHWDDCDPIIAATMDVVDAINDVQRAHNGECGPDWRIDEALARRRQTIRRLAEINEHCEQNPDWGF